MAKTGRRPGYVSTLRKFGGHKAKPQRCPEHWNTSSLYDALELFASLHGDAAEAIAQSERESKAAGKPLNSRLTKLSAFLAEVRDTCPELFEATQGT